MNSISFSTSFQNGRKLGIEESVFAKPDYLNFIFNGKQLAKMSKASRVIHSLITETPVLQLKVYRARLHHLALNSLKELEDSDGYEYDRALCYLYKKIVNVYPDQVEKMWKDLSSIVSIYKREETLASLMRSFGRENPFLAMDKVYEIESPGQLSFAKLQLVKGLCDQGLDSTLVGHALDIARSIPEYSYRAVALTMVIINQAICVDASYQLIFDEVLNALIEIPHFDAKVNSFLCVIHLLKKSHPYNAKNFFQLIQPLIYQLPKESLKLRFEHGDDEINFLKIVADLDPEYGIEFIDGIPNPSCQQICYWEYSEILAQINQPLARKCALKLKVRTKKTQMLEFIALQSLRNDPDLFTSTLLSMDEYPHIIDFTEKFAIELGKNDKKKGLQLLEQLYIKHCDWDSEFNMCYYASLFAELDKNCAHAIFHKAITKANNTPIRAYREDSLTQIAVKQAIHFPMEALRTIEHVTVPRRKLECLATIIAESVSINSFSKE